MIVLSTLESNLRRTRPLDTLCSIIRLHVKVCASLTYKLIRALLHTAAVGEIERGIDDSSLTLRGHRTYAKGNFVFNGALRFTYSTRITPR